MLYFLVKLCGISLCFIHAENETDYCHPHCVKSVRTRSYPSPHFPVFSPNAGKCGPERVVSKRASKLVLPSRQVQDQSEL